MNYLLTIASRLGQNLSMGVGIHTVFSLGGLFFLGFPGVMAVSAYTLAILEMAGWSSGAAFLTALLAAFLMGLFFSLLYVRISDDSFVVLSLISVVAVETLANSWSSLTNGTLGISGIARPALFPDLFSLTVGITLVAILLLMAEYVLLRTPLGRSIRAFKEGALLLSSMGISKNSIGIVLILSSSLIFSLAGIFIVWRVQVIDPSFSSLYLLIEIVTIGIIAMRPQLRYLLLATCFVVLIPELLRFLDLPSTLFGHLRSLLYSTMLIILIHLMRDKLYIHNRKV